MPWLSMIGFTLNTTLASATLLYGRDVLHYLRQGSTPAGGLFVHLKI
jgi:hypothetical protein